MESLESNHRPLLEAIAFAARVHQGQLRKDGRTPYASHVFRVCLIVRQAGNLTRESAGRRELGGASADRENRARGHDVPRGGALSPA